MHEIKLKVFRLKRKGRRESINQQKIIKKKT